MDNKTITTVLIRMVPVVYVVETKSDKKIAQNVEPV